ncbi:MAG: hypothetical protein CSA95_07005 [Bacteroidetes bacterium]|nr:MAG: hypothetical protein CSA95_07005 [Bacteroidota bacterium]
MWLFVATLFVNCGGVGSRGSHKGYLSPIEITIPDAIKSDKELTQLVKDSEGAINEFSNNMEALIEDLEPYKDVDMDEASTLVKIKMTKIAVEFLANSSKGIAVLEKLEEYADQRQNQQTPLTDEQMEAMAVIYDTFEARMEQLEEKYRDFGGK